MKLMQKAVVLANDVPATCLSGTSGVRAVRDHFESATGPYGVDIFAKRVGKTAIIKPREWQTMLTEKRALNIHLADIRKLRKRTPLCAD